MRKFRFNYDRFGVPDHTCIALEDYFFYGYEPGGFLTAVLCNDLMGACNRADHVNREHIVDIVKWLQVSAPPGSYGSQQTVKAWLKDVDNCRTDFKEDFEKRLMWKTLQETE